MFNRLVCPNNKSQFQVLLINLISFISSIWKIARYYWLKFKVYLSGKHPYRILPFTNIETGYLKRGVFKRDFQWQTILKESGNVYQRLLIVKKAKVTPQEQQKIIKEPNRCLFLGNNAGIFSSLGIIYDKEFDAIIAETLEHLGNEVSYSTQFTTIEYQVTPKIEGVSLSICSLFSDSNYAHFLLDAVSKIYLAKDLLSQIDNILISGSEKSFQRKTLNHLNLDQKLIWLESESHLECEQLLFTSRINHLSHVSPWGVNAIRKLFLQDEIVNNSKNTEKIIFASRKSSSIRKTILEEIVIANLPNAEVIDFSDLAMSETIQVCQDCRIFMGFHGAAFANLVFCNPGTKVIEFHLENSLYKTKYYFYSMAKYLKMNHQICTLSESMSNSEIKSIVANSIGLYVGV